MEVFPLHPEIVEHAAQRGLAKKLAKQLALFRNNPFHPGLETELLESRHLRIWSFRLDKKYRAIFIFRDANSVEIIDVNNHYR
jgi:Txe/YoeB family toxin of Txe-Axe toxin-antitoxin module